MLSTALLLLSAAATPAAQEKATAPAPDEVEWALYWNAGKICKDLIDECVDENGTSLFEIPKFSVSQLKCGRQKAEQTTCSFLSAQRDGSRVVQRERCTGILIRNGARSGWIFALSRRPRWRPILRCKAL